MIPIDCCVNDDHGNTTNKVSAIHFPGLELESTRSVASAISSGNRRRSEYVHQLNVLTGTGGGPEKV